MASEWRRAWPLPLAGAGGLFTAVLYVYSAGLFIGPLQEAFGWSRTTSTMGLMIVGLVAAIGNPFVGAVIDRFGPGVVAACGAVAYATAMASLGFAGPGLASWTLGWIFVAIASLAVSVPVWLVAIVRSFTKARGLALAIGYCGSSIAAMIVPIVTEWSIDAFGWRGAYRVIGLLALVVGGTSAFTVFRHASREKRAQASPRAMVTPAARRDLASFLFWRIAVMSLVATLGVIALTVHFVSIAVESGQTRESAAAIAGLIGVAGLFGRIAVGALLDRFPGTRIGPLLYSIPMLACLSVALFGASPALLGLLALATGLALGSELDLMAYMTTRYFGLSRYGLLFGVLTGLVGAGAGFGPVIASISRDLTGSYDILLLLLASAFLLCAVLVASLGPYPDTDKGQ